MEEWIREMKCFVYISRWRQGMGGGVRVVPCAAGTQHGYNSVAMQVRPVEVLSDQGEGESREACCRGRCVGA